MSYDADEFPIENMVVDQGCEFNLRDDRMNLVRRAYTVQKLEAQEDRDPTREMRSEDLSED